MAPRARVAVLQRNQILIDQIVPKRAQLKTVILSGNLDPNAQHLLDKCRVDLEKTIYQLLPKNVDQLEEIRLMIEYIPNEKLSSDPGIAFKQVIKPCENPFRLLVFFADEYEAKFKTYPPDAVKYYGLDNYSESCSAYCNSATGFFISGGDGRGIGTKDFWKINNINYNIEKLDLPIKKEKHSMIYAPKKYIYFVGGCNKDTFFFNTFTNTFGTWAPLNHEKKSPALALVNGHFLYAISEQKDQNDLDFIERTNLTSNPSWEIINVRLNEPFPMKSFGAAVGYDNKIYFLGGRRDKGEKTYCFNTNENAIEPCVQENSSLKIGDKTFYTLNKYNSALIPNELREDIQVILFNRQKK